MQDNLAVNYALTCFSRHLGKQASPPLDKQNLRKHESIIIGHIGVL